MFAGQRCLHEPSGALLAACLCCPTKQAGKVVRFWDKSSGRSCCICCSSKRGTITCFGSFQLYCCQLPKMAITVQQAVQ